MIEEIEPAVKMNEETTTKRLQGCLREEEWQHADQESVDVIAPQL